MKLAVIDGEGRGRCLLCNWSIKGKDYKGTESFVQDHLKKSHDRLLLTKQKGLEKDTVVIEIHGRRFDSDWWKK